MDLDAWSACLHVLADPTRVRLLALLEREELTVAELASITRLAQPRVSTHLSKLKEADLVRDRRAGVSAYYCFTLDNLEPAEQKLWGTLRDATDDPLLRQDAERLQAVISTRSGAQNWADSVAGDMERHYSPGRTWEALARSALPMLAPGHVLDIASGDGVLAELLAPFSQKYTCIDSSQKVVAAATERLQTIAHVEVLEGDMQALPFADEQFDLVLLMHALTYADAPAQAVIEAARVLKTNGNLLITSLAKHEHRATVEPYGHINLGFTAKELKKMAEKAKLRIVSCDVVTREKRPPHFEVISLLAERL